LQSGAEMADESCVFCISCFLRLFDLVTFVADRQARLEQERLSIMKAPRSVIQADLNVQFASAQVLPRS
jgi:hypothetical protein